MRKWGSAVLAATLFASTASFAGTDAQNQGTLAPGGAAGVEKAQGMAPGTIMAVVGIAIGAAIVAEIASNGSSGGSVSTTTSTTP